MTTKIVDLDALVADQRVKIGGAEYPVKAASAKVAKLARSVTEDTQVDIALEIVRRICPTMPPEVLDELTIVQLLVIVQVSSEGILQVQDSFPNEERPTTESSSPA